MFYRNPPPPENDQFQPHYFVKMQEVTFFIGFITFSLFIFRVRKVNVAVNLKEDNKVKLI